MCTCPGLSLSPTTTMHHSFRYRSLLTASEGGENIVVTTAHFLQSNLEFTLVVDADGLSSFASKFGASFPLYFILSLGNCRILFPANTLPDVAILIMFLTVSFLFTPSLLVSVFCGLVGLWPDEPKIWFFYIIYRIGLNTTQVLYHYMILLKKKFK